PGPRSACAASPGATSAASRRASSGSCGFPVTGGTVDRGRGGRRGDLPVRCPARNGGGKRGGRARAEGGGGRRGARGDRATGAGGRRRGEPPTRGGGGR